MTIVIFHLRITVFCLMANLRSRSLFYFVFQRVFLGASARLGILLIAV
ncbi:hypothetical protein HMPREF3212_02749 [Citrobacter freundii]|nr:hypothetical protein HMPREF3212_02749 [Citrobacter freundii]